ncbi:TOMM precursor leader peptide-binding protein [Streptomyces sp. NPDC096324]|uniref:TOMM precursor leader peptide-binding protein n=1 Tax=Streptomyces sp. NPDC096324 TaxID=3366085 RepID=UPI00382F4EE4
MFDETAPPPRAESRSGTAASAGPWDAVCADLTAAVADRAACHRPVAPPAVVIPFGFRDELTAEPRDFPAGTVVVGLYGHHAVVGPARSAGIPGCPQCLARRWQAVRAGFLRDAVEVGDRPRASGSPPWRAGFAVDALAGLVAATARQPRPARYPHVWLLDLETLRVSRFPLVPDGECPSCGTRPDDTADAARIALDPTPKQAPDVFRLRPLDAYDLVPEALTNPVTGMLGPSVVSDLTVTSTSSTAGAFTSRSGTCLRDCHWGGHTGAYATSVRAGLVEGMERYAGIRARAKRTVVSASLDELGDMAVDPRATGMYSEAFPDAEPDTPRFAPDRRVNWVWGWSLHEGRPVLVPEAMAYHHVPGGRRRRFVRESSNGSASGGCLAEAVYHGLMDTVERDAFQLAWFGRARLPEIDAFTSTRLETRAMVDRLAIYGYRARFFDTRITFPVPVVTAVAERADGEPGPLRFGAGASLDPEAALAAALREIAAGAVGLRRRAVSQDFRPRRAARDVGDVRALHDDRPSYGLPETGRCADFLVRRPDDADQVPLASVAVGPGTLRPSADLRDDVEACVAAATARGFDVVVVDQTAPEQRDLGLRTVKVMVPGLMPSTFGRSRRSAVPDVSRSPRAARDRAPRGRP